MTDTASPQGKDDSISSILKEANEIINEFEGKPKDKDPPLKLSDGSEMNDAAKRAKLMMANAQQQLQARQQKISSSPTKRKAPAGGGTTTQQTPRPPVQPPRQQHILGDAGVNNNTMAQMLGVLMARVDFLEKDNTKSKELVQRVKTLEISIEKISMIINKLSGKIDSIPKGNTEQTEALIKQVDIMREKFHDSKSLMLRMDKLEKRGASGIPIGVSGIAGNETLLARVATLEENVNTTTDRLMGLRIRTKSVMTRVDCLEEIARSSKSPDDVKKMQKMEHLNAPSNSITNELAMKVDYLEQKLGSIQSHRSSEQNKEPLNQQILMARVEALEEESRRKVGIKTQTKRAQNTTPKTPKSNVKSPSFLGIKKLNIKCEPSSGEAKKPTPKRASRDEKPKGETKKKAPVTDVIDTNTILGLLDEIDREDNDSAKEKDKKEAKTPFLKEKKEEKIPAVKQNVTTPRPSETSEDDDEALSKFISNKRKSSEKSNLKVKLSPDTARKKASTKGLLKIDPFASPIIIPKPYVDPFATPDEDTEAVDTVESNPKPSISEPKQKIPIKISLKPLKKQTPDLTTDSELGAAIDPLGDIQKGAIDENNNLAVVDIDEKEKFGNPIFDSLPLTSPNKDDAANRLKRAQKYFKKGGPRHKFFT